MKITFIGHAAILQETRGVSVLSDPWWGAPCFGAQWWNFPRAIGESLETRKLDYIYISHGHHDHLHPGTLRRLNKSAQVIVPRGLGLAPAVSKLGLRVVEVASEELVDLGGGVRARIMPTHGGDSLMVLEDGDEVCVNLNDSLHSAPEAVKQAFIDKLKTVYGTIDYVFCGYGVASHFPNCYRIPGKNREATAARRQMYFNEQWARIVAGLTPRFAFPFAADVVFLDENLIWANEPTHNSERPIQALRRIAPGFRGRAYDIAPGFQIVDGEVVEPTMRQPIDAEALRAEMSEEIQRANRHGSPSRESVDGICGLISANIEKCGDYLRSYPADYRILIKLGDAVPGILLEKTATIIGARVIEDVTDGQYDLEFLTRSQYLRTSLTRPYGHEVIFVGSGGVFQYASRAVAKKRLQQELWAMIRVHESSPAPRAQSNAPLLAVKRLIKRALGRREFDLYDLEAWTVWDSAG